MKVKEYGRILELDPTKEYILFVKAGSILAKSVKQNKMNIKIGAIYFVGDMDEFNFVSISDNVARVSLIDSSMEKDDD